MVQDLGLKVADLGFRAPGLGFSGWDLGARLYGFRPPSQTQLFRDNAGSIYMEAVQRQ